MIECSETGVSYGLVKSRKRSVMSKDVEAIPARVRLELDSVTVCPRLIQFWLGMAVWSIWAASRK